MFNRVQSWSNLQMDSSLVPFFKPKGVVLVGASTSPEKLGYGAARNLIQSGYQGAIHFVSQKDGVLFERPLYTSLAQIPDPVDLAILIIPPAATPQAIEHCGQRGIKAAVIVSSGFREAGAEGAALEQKCVDVARAQGVRLLGPNCIGTIDTHLPLDTTFLQPPMPTQGHIGFISHSGAFCAAIVDWSRQQGFGFSRIVSLGNQADVNETDMLPMLAADEQTRVMVLYMESVSDGHRFVEVASEVTCVKPVVALKVGRFESGQRAAASHTGALAASDIAFEAAFEKAGILRADTTEQMFDWARALEAYPGGLPLSGLRDAPQLVPGYPSKRLRQSGRHSTNSNHGIAILTNAGGPGVIAADALEHRGLRLAQLSDVTLKALPTILPPAASLHNPVDMLASASPGQYAECLRILLEDDNVDAVMLILPPPPMFKAEDVAKKIVETLESSGLPLADSGALALSDSRKPVVVALLGSTLIENAAQVLQRAGIPTYPFPERAASALSALVKRAEDLATETQSHRDSIISPRLGDSHRPDVLSGAVSLSPDELISVYDIQSAPMKLARDEGEAIVIAKELGYPVVMKIASPDILHKSDVGGVILNIGDSSSVQNAYTQIMERVKKSKPDAQIDGVHLQRQIPNGQEVIVGMVRDPQFGPLMMFGSGGVEVEGLKDVAFALAPLNQAEAEKMIRKTWAGRKLKGFRRLTPADEESVLDALLKLSRLAIENENIDEIEINPLRVLERGAVAVDVRLKRVEVR
ncbi:MAG TPA: acetate--CoA ligase family protein [Anaerolineales bacterium]|nr:acetate--CoA ligase family protein [Anaerolineales bacterium]